MNKHRLIHLHIYKGKQGVQGVATDQNGKVVNENHLVKIKHNTKEWDNYLKMMVTNGFVKVDVIGFCDGVEKDGSFIYSEVPESIVESVNEALHGHKKIAMTPEQKEIAELKSQMAELLKGKKEPKAKEVKEKDIEIDAELKEARAKYFEAFGKQGNKLWKVETILSKIEEKENK